MFAKPKVGSNAAKNSDTDQTKQPTGALRQSENTAIVSYMGEVNKAIDLQSGIDINGVIDP